MSSKKASPYRQLKGTTQYVKKKGKNRKKQKNRQLILILVLILLLMVIAAGVFFIIKKAGNLSIKKAADSVTAFIPIGKKDRESGLIEMEEDSQIPFTPSCTENTDPSKFIAQTGICIDGTELADESTYIPEGEISFRYGSTYTDLEGVLTFRGNNFRDSPAYGTAEMTENHLKTAWSQDTSSLSYNGAYWSGSGWTGQPLIVKWPQKTRSLMNMYDWAKSEQELTEVIYACMDGYVYFFELETGKPTREKLYLGYTFKGAGALDPRGYPIMYVGAGYDSDKGTAHVFIINLLDCSVMYEFGANDPYSLRGSLSYFDSSALVDAETDTLIYPGENGILYRIKLNTAYDEEAGTLKINPGPVVKWRYYGQRSSTSSFWIGMEDSAAIYKGYLFIADNGGNLMCLNLNTMQLVWVQDTLDDSNSTPVLSVEDNHLYLYVSTSFRLGWRSSYSATVPVWKIDAENGEIVWQKDYECDSDDGVSGGVQSTIAVGKNDLSDYIYVTVARTGEFSKGVLACINKKTGEAEWEHKSAYSWSSPVCVYDSQGKGRVIYCNSVGDMYLLDGKTGTELHKLELNYGNIEASPAVYNDYLVVGTRECKVLGIKLE